MVESWLPAALVFLAAASGVVVLVLLVEWFRERAREKEMAEQLKRLETEGLSEVLGSTGSLLRGNQETGWLDSFAVSLPQLRDLDHVIKQGGLTWTLQKFFLLSLGIAAALGLGAWVIFGFGLVMAAVAGVGAALPFLYVRRKRKQRLGMFEEQLPEAVDLVGRAIRAGHPLGAGLRMVAEEMHDPIRTEFRQVFEEQRFGLAFEEALFGMADRVPLIDVRILVTAILIQREVGGNLAEILDKLSHIIRVRFQIRRQLLTYTAEARMSMWTLMGLPPAVALIMFFMNPSYIMTLFQEPAGHFMIYAALVMQFMGFLWIRKIVDIEI
jgi:tight adherence protein B